MPGLQGRFYGASGAPEIILPNNTLGLCIRLHSHARTKSIPNLHPSTTSTAADIRVIMHFEIRYASQPSYFFILNIHPAIIGGSPPAQNEPVDHQTSTTACQGESNETG